MAAPESPSNPTTTTTTTTSTQQNQQHGSCLCRAVQYTLTGAPLTTVLCHCTNCQKTSGAPFQANAIYGRAQFQLLHGRDSVTTYHDTATDAGDGVTVHRNFCAACGSTLFTTNDSNAFVRDKIIVATGTLDDAEAKAGFVPAQEFYVKRKFGFVAGVQGTEKFAAMS